MTITTGSFAKDLWPGVESWYGTKYAEYPVEWTDVFESRNSTKAFEEIVGMRGFGLAPIKTEGAAITYEDTGQAFIDRFTHSTFALGFTITREMYEDGIAATEALRRAQALAFTIRQTEETVCANILNRAFNSSYTYGDGKELCATDHPYYGGGTWRNELATAADLEETSLEQCLIDIATQFKTDKGLQIAVRPKKMIIPPALVFEAERILKSMQQNDTANNAVNAIRSSGILSGGYAINHYLTDANAFFILTDCPDGMVRYNRRAAEFANENDFATENMKCKATIRFSVGCGDKRGIFGSPGAN
jgi:hypothetical protein